MGIKEIRLVKALRHSGRRSCDLAPFWGFSSAVGGTEMRRVMMTTSVRPPPLPIKDSRRGRRLDGWK
jgi:hypothetical protein